MEIVSNCCSAPEWLDGTGLCSACKEHCDFVDLELEEKIEQTNLVENYIDWQSLQDDFDLKWGGLAPEQYIKLSEVLQEYLRQNRF